jgi:hypothetical protein
LILHFFDDWSSKEDLGSGDSDEEAIRSSTKVEVKIA